MQLSSQGRGERMAMSALCLHKKQWPYVDTVPQLEKQARLSKTTCTAGPCASGPSPDTHAWLPTLEAY